MRNKVEQYQKATTKALDEYRQTLAFLYQDQNNHNHTNHWRTITLLLDKIRKLEFRLERNENDPRQNQPTPHTPKNNSSDSGE